MSHSSEPPGSSSHPSPRYVGRSHHDAFHPAASQTTPAATKRRFSQAEPGPTALPPLATLTTAAEPPATTASPTTRRSTGLHNILNPTEHSSQQQMRPAPTSDAYAAATEHPPAVRPFASPRGRKRHDSRSPGLDGDAPASIRAGRRILTPRSPGLRAASLGAHRSPSMSSSYGSRTSMPASEGRQYTAEPGQHGDAVIPPMPPLPVTRSALPAIQTSDHERHGLRRASTTAATTPVTSHAMHPPFMGASNGHGPASGLAHPPPHHGPHSATLAAEATTPYTGFHGASMGSGLPRVQSGWKMALDTGQGREVVDINIDYQQASKMADEKRKRNAGASARFRARRKEKEKESSQMISGLQQDLLDMTDERDFYLSERNFYRDLLARTNTVIPPRPSSPGSRHSLGMGVSTTENSPTHPYAPREGPEMTAQHRRTSDYHPPYPPPGQPYSYPNTAPPPPYPADHRGQTHPPHVSHGPPPPPLAPPRSQDVDSYRRDPIDRRHAPPP